MSDNLEDAKAVSDNESTADLDLIECELSVEESKEFKEFHLKINDTELWEPPASMAKFLDKYFNKCLEHQAISTDFLKPQCDALQAPRMDPEVEE